MRREAAVSRGRDKHSRKGDAVAVGAVGKLENDARLIKKEDDDNEKQKYMQKKEKGTNTPSAMHFRTVTARLNPYPLMWDDTISIIVQV